MKISVVILTKNEEEMIKDCLLSVDWADEIIIIDDYSIDKTLENVKSLSKNLNLKIYQNHLNNNFANQRNFGLKKASGDFVLYLDADERVSKELALEIKNNVLKNKESFSAYRLKRQNFYLGKHPWPYIEKLERLFKKEKLKGWQGLLHESPIIEGRIGELNGFLIHFSHQNLSLMLQKTIEWSKIEADLRFTAGHPKITWWRFLRVIFTTFFEYFIKQKGFKAGMVGLIESIYQSFSMFITYARLWEKQEYESRNL